MNQVFVTRGRGSSDYCEKQGYAILRHGNGGHIVVKTHCRTWRCLSCRDKNRARVVSLIQYGCSTLVNSWLVTVTYKRDGRLTPRPATRTLRDLGRLYEMLRQKHPNLTYLRVPELTKKKQVHFHHLMGGLGDAPDACERFADYRRDWRERTCLCLEHELSPLWHQITGDSFVVDVSKVLLASALASYLAKYVTKSMDDRAPLVAAGYTRRWSTSRNWPRSELLTRGFVDDEWESTEFVGGFDEELEELAQTSRTHRLLERVGSVEAMAYDSKRQRKLKVAAWNKRFGGQAI